MKVHMKENMKENIQRIWGESLKSLKSLMQIFAESAESANSAKQIFATFATFATFAMQIFHKGSYSAVRVSSVQQPTNFQRISNLSLTVSTVKVAQKSRIRQILPLFATNSVLSRLCLVSLIWMLLVVGAFTSSVWGDVCYAYTNTGITHNLSTKDANQVIFETDVFENVVGIDSIWFTYNTHASGPKIEVFYSTDEGSTYTSIDTDGKKANNGDRNVGDALTTSSMQSANRFKFMTQGGGGWWIARSIDVKDIYVRVAKAVRLNTSSFEFPQTAVDASKDQTFTVSTYSITATPTVNITGTNASYFGWALSDPTSGCPKTRTLTITYSPGEEADEDHKHTATVTVSAAGKSATLTVYGTAREIATSEFSWNGEDTYDVDADSLDLSTLWTSTGGGAISYSITSFTPASGEHSGSIAPTKVGNKISLGKAGTLVLGLSQAEGNGYTGGTDSKTITIARRNPVFAWNAQDNYYYNTTVSSFVTKTSGASYTVTSDNEQVANLDGANLKIYNKAGTAHIRTYHPQTYKYNEYDQSETVTPGWKNNQLPITSLTSANISTYEVSKSAEYVDWFENVEDGHTQKGYRMGRGGAYNTSNEAIVGFTGIPDSMFFDVHIEKYAGILPSDGERECKIYESPVNTPASYTLVGDYSEKTEWKDGLKARLKPTTRFVKFVYNGTIKCHYNNIVIQKREIFKTDSTSLDFDTNLKGSSPAAQTFKFYHASAGYITSVTSDDAHFTVTPSSVITGGEVCDSAVITVNYLTTEAGSHSGRITITDNIGNSTYVNVTGVTQDKLATHLVYLGESSYNVNHDNIAATTLFEVRDANNALVASPVITLSSNATAVINTINDNTAIDFLCGGSATITASYAGDETYAAASDLGQSITVNKVADEITWGAAVVNDTLRVYADQDIAYSLATAHTSATKPITYTSGDATILRVTPGESSDALHTLKYDTVSLTATTTTDCFYSSVSSSIVVVVLPCKHRIVWNQTFGYHTESDGTINQSVTLNAYAVDSTGARTNVAISYTMPSVSFARIDEGVLEINGTGETTIIARTATDNKYATAEVERSVIVRISGENVAYAYNNGDDVKGGDIVIEGPHATFTISGDDDIYYYTGGSCGDDGYFLASIDKEQSKTYTLSWTCDESCMIEVTNISFWAKAYNWSTARTSKARIIFNGKNKPVGTAALTCSSGDYAKFEESGSFSSPMTIECQNTHTGSDVIPPHDFDFYLKNIVIEYTITAKTPTGSETDLAATLSPDDKQTAALGSLFSMANPASDFAYEYQLKEDYTNAYIEGGNFYATYGGDYEVQSRVAPYGDHKASEWSTSTIHVTRTCVFNNEEGDKNWETTGNWAYNAEPTADDAVRVLGNLTIDEQIEMLSLSIEGAAVVEIDPEGGLTVGAGGISGATTSNLILKAGTEGATKGQTGYLRISPEYTGAMPEATVELFNMTYFNTSTNEAELQCVGAPIVNVKASTVFPAGSYLYTWDEENDTWVSARTKLTFEAFKGFDVTQRKAAAGFGFEYAGQLISVSDEKTINLSHSGSGHNLLANSFTAPISIEEFESTDFSNANQTIYILNAGTKAQSHEQEGGVDAPGKWVGVPIKTASELAEEGYPTMIAPMQGFWIVATGDGAQLKLDYSRLVWDVTYSGVNVNKPLRAPKRNGIQDNEKAEITGKLKVNVYSVRENDVLFMLESPSFDTSYEDGYDAHKIASGSLDVYTLEDEGELGIDATNSIIGTRIGVRTGGETAYTMSFERVVNEKDMVLWDIEAEEKVEISEGQTYTFFAEPNSEITGRFIIVEAEAPEIATGVEDVQGDAKVHKFIKDDKLFILKNGVLYDATGRRVRQE